MQHLFSVWQEISHRLRTAGRVLLLCDYDGTLTPIVDSPELADLPEGTRHSLQNLSLQGRLTVGIISGRALADLKQRVGIGNIVYAGNHGLEIEGPGIGIVNPLAEEMRPVFRLIQQVLSKALTPIRGTLVENKGLSLSVHYRMVEKEKSEEVRTVFETVMATARSLGKVRITSGKMVYEVRPPVDWDKGKAIALLIDRYSRHKNKKETLPIFLGDDRTDEDGFKVIREHSGIPIFVGNEPAHTAASYYLRSPQEAEQFLSLLCMEML